MSVALRPSVQEPVNVGNTITWTAEVPDGGSSIWYRFRIGISGSDLRTVRDYSPVNTLAWTPSEHEGVYAIEVSAWNRDSGESAVESVTYEILPSVSADTPAVSPTQNPLVFLYSAPACTSGSRMHVEFQASDGIVQRTPDKDCTPDLSMNFYLAGFRAETSYSAWHVITTGTDQSTGPVQSLTTPKLDLPPLAGYSVLKAPQNNDGILLQSTFTEMTVATDLSGNIVWFYPAAITYATRPEAGGFLYILIEDPTGPTSNQVVRKINLAGNVILETNAGIINEQLNAMGKREITSFHHEARDLPDGKILLLASSEQILVNMQGDGEADVIGDTILILDKNLQVTWVWDSFDFLDPHRVATLGEQCTPAAPGCSTYYLATQANDWLHGNSVQFTPDGNLLYSARHQDWLLKIAYQNGAGDGSVLWRLGQDGDFQIDSADLSPWFSHQHDAGFEPGDNGMLLVFDNANVQHSTDAGAHSRGQLFKLDEQTRKATLLLNFDLGSFSRALGSAQKLPNGNYHFNIGWTPNNKSISVEIDPSGNVQYAIQIDTMVYRTFRMRDLYTP
jgi:hypothetical protein